jgi:2,3-bisphosphoglycerate-independent phosphoglycerate mutase
MYGNFNAQMIKKRPVLLMILDGYGINRNKAGNAIAAARTPNLDRLFSTYPHCELDSSGESVGLPEGQMGNSEVGHLNIGAGRIVYQDLTRITRSIHENEFKKNRILLDAMNIVKSKGSSLQLMGLLSDGGVHSHISHLYALLALAREQGIKKVYVHAFLDGRDVPPKSALAYIEDAEKKMKEPGGEVATISGRYYAMDRDNRWERVEKAYDAMTKGEGIEAQSAAIAVKKAYERGENDEFIAPTVIFRNDKPVSSISDNDVIIFFNFRSDRAREITRAFIDDNFNGFKRKSHPDAYFVCLTQYDETFDVPFAFPPEPIKNILAEVLSKNNLRQLRIAETEKYAHVTFFFNGGVEAPVPGEERILIPSPKVATYDLQPEMSAFQVTDRAVKAVSSGKYDVIILNYANCDMVGHTGVFDAAVKAVEAIDMCVGMVYDTVIQAGGLLIITADHGNAEKMVDEAGRIHTAHTSNNVPFIFCEKGIRLRDGILADIAPTILEALSIEKPEEMTGRPLILS